MGKIATKLKYEAEESFEQLVLNLLKLLNYAMIHNKVHRIRPGCPPAQYSLIVQNRGKNTNHFISFPFVHVLCTTILGAARMTKSVPLLSGDICDFRLMCI